MGVAERYEEKKKKQNTTLYNGVANRYKSKRFNEEREELVSRINAWAEDNNRLADSYKQRFEGREAGKYVSDSGEWLRILEEQGAKSDAEAASIRERLDYYKDFIGADWSKSVLEQLDSGAKFRSDVFDEATADHEYWSQWATEDDYNAYYAELKAEEDYNRHFENIDAEKAAEGWQKYLDDIENAKNAPKYDLNNDGKDAWWEKAIGYLAGSGGGVVDTTLPNAGATQTIHDLRADESHRRPKDDWSEAQKNAFGELYAVSPLLAYDFAEETNKRNGKGKEEDKIIDIVDSATSNGWAGAGHTLGAIATAPFGLADFLGDLTMANAGKEITPDSNISPFEYSQAVTGGISEHLNEKYGTVDDETFVIGGKGLGDLFSRNEYCAKLILRLCSRARGRARVVLRTGCGFGYGRRFEARSIGGASGSVRYRSRCF